MKPKILITGANGFLGYHLLHAAKEAGFSCHAAVRAHRDMMHITPLVEQFIELPYDSISDMEALLRRERYDSIIHAAATTREKDESIYELVNVRYAENLALAALLAGSDLTSFVFISSLAAVGPIRFDAPQLLDEASAMHPVTGYGRSKMRAENRLMQIGGLPLYIFRPTAIYGPREKDLLTLFKMVLSGWDIHIGRKPQKLSFIHATDVARTVVRAIMRKPEGTPIYTLSDGLAYDRYAFANTLAELAHKKPFRIHVPRALVSGAARVAAWCYQWSASTPLIYPERINELSAESWHCHIGKAQNELGYQAQYNLRDGLAETLHWYEKEGWLAK